MAAPTVVARSTPTGFKMPDGYRALWAFANKPAIQLWEKQVKSPGVDGGEGIDTTTMHNNAYRTKAARHLKTLSDGSFAAAYDPDVIVDILAQTNIEQSITVHFPDNSSWSFWGYMQKWEPAELKEGEFPEATVTIVITNWDPMNFVEAGPVYTPASGT
jgi:hypothetical protein